MKGKFRKIEYLVKIFENSEDRRLQEEKIISREEQKIKKQQEESSVDKGRSGRNGKFSIQRIVETVVNLARKVGGISPNSTL